MPRRQHGLLAAALSALLLPAAVTASSARTPAQLLSSMLAAARTHHSVHYVTRTQIGATIRFQMVCDVAQTSGIQRITFQQSSRTGHVTVIVARGTAYFRGDAFTLVDFMGLKKAPAAKYAGKWVSIPKTDPLFASVSEAVTFSSTIDELKLIAPLKALPPSKIGTVRVVGVSGRDPSSQRHTGAAAVYAPATGSPLPLAEVAVQGSSRSGVRFAGWDERVSANAPVGAVAIGQTGLE